MINKLTYREAQQECKKAGLCATGTHMELLTRLRLTQGLIWIKPIGMIERQKIVEDTALRILANHYNLGGYVPCDPEDFKQMFGADAWRCACYDANAALDALIDATEGTELYQQLNEMKR